MLGLVLCCLMAVTYGLVDVLAASMMHAERERTLSQAAHSIAQHLEEDISDIVRDLKLASQASSLLSVFADGFSGNAQQRLGVSKAAISEYAWIAMADLGGKIVAATDDSLLGLNVADQAWFYRRRSSETLIDAAAEPLQSDTPAPIAALSRFLEISVPVQGRDKRVIGILGAGVKPALAQSTRDLGITPISHLFGIEAVIATGTGRVLAGRPDAAPPGPFVAAPADFFEATADRGTLELLPGLDWRVIVRQPRVGSLRALQGFRLTAMACFAIVALLALAMSESIARTFARPFEALARFADGFKNDPDRSAVAPPAATAEALKLTAALVDAFETVRRSESQLRRSNDELERLVAERTKELAEAKDRAEAATRAKGEFLATMSHEIRSPLGSIVGLTDLMLEGDDLVGRQRGRLELIQSASAGLTALVNDVLDLSKVESDTIELADEPFDLHRLLDTCCGLIQVQAEHKGLELVRDWPADLPAFRGDELRLRQVVTNLLSNAVKFTGAGSVTLTLRYGRRRGDRVHVDVVDTGIGIPADRLDRLFRRYAQADATTQRDYGGTGLGLAISQRLVELMGGSIEVVSVVGRGSTFRFSLPLPEAYLDRMSEVGKLADPSRPLRILLADDLAANREFVGALLRSEGHTVQVVCDGLEAKDLASREAFDVILLDIQMPSMGGVAAATLIGSGGINADTPMIALTANIMPEQLARFRDAGMCGHVAKPIVRRELMATIGKAVGRHAGVLAGDRAA